METNEKNTLSTFNINSNSILKIDEIVDFINKLGYKIDRSMIESNESDVVVELYCSILEKIGIIKKEKLKIKFFEMDVFSYPGLHDRPIYILKLFNIIKKFIVEVIGLDNFSTSDLFTPNFKRTKKILSGIIKFYKFRQAEKETYSSIKENLEKSISVNKENNNKVKKSKSIFLETKQKKENEIPEVLECNKNLDDLVNTKEDLKNKIKDFEEKLKDKLKENEDLVEKIKNIDFINESSSAKINNLKGLIVHSPEKSQKIIEELKTNNEAISQFNTENEINQKNLEKQQKFHEGLLKYLNEYETLILDLEKLTIKFEEKNEIIYNLKEEENKKEKDLFEIKSNIESIEKSIINLSDYSLEFHNKQKKALEIKDDTSNNLKEKIQNFQKRINELNESIKLQNSNNKIIEENVNEIEKLKSDYFNQIESLMNNLLNLATQYSNNFHKILDSKS